MDHSATDRYKARIIMSSLVRRHASEITLLFGNVSPAECQNHTNITMAQMYTNTRWSVKLTNLFRKFNSELAIGLNCKKAPDCDMQLFLHTMQHVAHLLRHTPVLFLWSTRQHKIYDALLLMVHGNCIDSSSKLKKERVCALFASAEKLTIKFADLKKQLNSSLCHMSASYLYTTNRLQLQPNHPQAAIDTLIFKQLYDLVINKGDKRLALLFLSMLPEMMGSRNMYALLQKLSMHMHTFLNQVIKRTMESTSRKFIRLYFAAAGRCTCHTKCSVYGKVAEIQMLAVCKTCRNSPVFRQAREPRCRRTISSTSFINVCSVDGNTSFIYIPIYRAYVNKTNGQLIYEHWAYTLSLSPAGLASEKATFYMLCAGGNRTCTTIILSDSLAKTKCQQCSQDKQLERTCLTEKVGSELSALCDGCIIAACCPVHVPQHKARRNLWLSILEFYTGQDQSDI